MAELPPPPIPADADLTDFKFMPLEVARLRRSKAWLICKRRPELAFFMLNLWTVSWHERPAGSLEDDDDVLADAAMCSPERWAKVRTEVLRGWFKAADGRLYHPVVAEKVADSWHGKAVARWSKECDRIRKENHKRKENQQPPLEFPTKPPRNVAAFPPDDAGIPPEKPLKGEGRKGIGKGEDSLPPETVPAESGAAAPVSDLSDPEPIPDFLVAMPSSARAAEIPPDWLPSEVAQANLARSRPDITPEIVQQRMVAFRTWCSSKRILTHNADASWLGFMLNTKEAGYGERGRGPSAVQHGGESPESVGIAAAFSRRSLQPGG